MRIRRQEPTEVSARARTRVVAAAIVAVTATLTVTAGAALAGEEDPKNGALTSNTTPVTAVVDEGKLTPLPDLSDPVMADVPKQSEEAPSGDASLGSDLPAASVVEGELGGAAAPSGSSPQDGPDIAAVVTDGPADEVGQLATELVEIMGGPGSFSDLAQLQDLLDGTLGQAATDELKQQEDDDVFHLGGDDSYDNPLTGGWDAPSYRDQEPTEGAPNWRALVEQGDAGHPSRPDCQPKGSPVDCVTLPFDSGQARDGTVTFTFNPDGTVTATVREAGADRSTGLPVVETTVYHPDGTYDRTRAEIHDGSVIVRHYDETPVHYYTEYTPTSITRHWFKGSNPDEVLVEVWLEPPGPAPGESQPDEGSSNASELELCWDLWFGVGACSSALATARTSVEERARGHWDGLVQPTEGVGESSDDDDPDLGLETVINPGDGSFVPSAGGDGGGEPRPLGDPCDPDPEAPCS